MLVAGRLQHRSSPCPNDQIETAKNPAAQEQRSRCRDRQRRSALASAATPTPCRLTGGAQIPIAQAVPLQSVSRGFLPWRVSDAGRTSTPQCIIAAGIRNPSQFRPIERFVRCGNCLSEQRCNEMFRPGWVRSGHRGQVVQGIYRMAPTAYFKMQQRTHTSDRLPLPYLLPTFDQQLVIQ